MSNNRRSVRPTESGAEGPPGDEALARLTRLNRALADPVRLRMLQLMAEGRACCETCRPTAVPAGGRSEGICVCEFQNLFGVGQSRVSYHLKVLKESGLVDEEARGRWSLYSLNRGTARELIGLLKERLGV